MVIASPRIHEMSNKALLEGLSHFTPKFFLALDFPDYTVRTAQSGDEVMQALQLRYQVFYQELGALSLGETTDIDGFDLIADHLLLIDKKTQTTVGTYRFLCSRFTERFYSETEFDLSAILALDGEKLELGRACIHPAHRNSSAIQLLWKGMTSYFSACGARYMFGCSSVDSHLEPYFGMIHQYLNKHHLASASHRVIPHQNVHAWVNLDAILDDAGERKAERMVPSLLKAYLKAGSKVAGLPFWDPVFSTLDYFTLFDQNDITESYARKYNLATA